MAEAGEKKIPQPVNFPRLKVAMKGLGAFFPLESLGMPEVGGFPVKGFDLPKISACPVIRLFFFTIDYRHLRQLMTEEAEKSTTCGFEALNGSWKQSHIAVNCLGKNSLIESSRAPTRPQNFALFSPATGQADHDSRLQLDNGMGSRDMPMALGG